MSSTLEVRENSVGIGENEKVRLDPSDPRVRKLVYSMYRDMLTNRNHEANKFISQKDPSCVKQDLGVVPILESIMRQGSGGSGGSTSVSSPPAPPMPPMSSNENGTAGIPPPPPPMVPSGQLPAVRLSSEVGPLNKGPPKQIQGAMMKDKKPFTYTPGGIDLSEIRSPRMAQRIQMNAAAEGVTNCPSPHAQSHANGGTGNQPHPPLPPAALAAMQPQTPIAVFPQGGFSQANLHRTVKPNDFLPPQQQTQSGSHNSNYPQNFMPGTCVPPPPPGQPFNIPTAQEHRQGLAPKDSAPRPTSPRPPPMSLASLMNQSVRPLPEEPTTQVQSHQLSDSPASLPQHQTKAQAVSQQIGSIYIPPVPTSIGDNRSQPPQMNINISSMKKSPQSPGTAPEFDSDRDTGIGNINSKTSSSSSTPLTPQLNKAPTPWLNSQNRQHQEVIPPYVTKGTANATPWGPSLTTRIVPISLKEDEDETEAKSVPMQRQQQQQQQQPNYAPTQQGGTWVIPIQIQGQGSQQRPQIPQQQPAYSSPKGLFSAHHGGRGSGNIQGQQKPDNAALNESMNKMSISQEDGYRSVPIQSKSFKVIQRITDDAEKQQHKLVLEGEDKQLMDSVKGKVDDVSSLHQTSEPRFRGGHIPSRTFQTLRNHLPPSPEVTEQLAAPGFPGRVGPVTHNIQIQMAPHQQHLPPPPPQQYQYQNPGFFPSQQQQVPEPRKYMGGNIPSRSFKVLQAMNPEDDPGSALEGSSPAGVIQINTSIPTPSPSPSPTFYNGRDTPVGLGEFWQDSASTGQRNTNASPESSGSNELNWDAYWYYYWYWASFWNSMGYETPPEGWDTARSVPTTPTRDLHAPPVPIPSKLFKNLQKCYDEYDSGTDSTDTEGTELNNTACDKTQGMNGKAEEGPDQLAKNLKDCAKTRRAPLRSIPEDESEGTETEGGSDAEMSSDCGIVEEPPETPGSYAEDEVFSLSPPQRVSIEECPSDSDSESPLFPHRKDHLSTIDELSETDRSKSPGVSSSTEYIDSSDEDSETEDSSTSDQESSASVIENRSGSGNPFDGSGVQDEGTNSSEENTDDDDDVEGTEAHTTVTVRLPLKRSFTKSKSYRDIATVFLAATNTDKLRIDCGEDRRNPGAELPESIPATLDSTYVKEDSKKDEMRLENEPEAYFTLNLPLPGLKNAESPAETTTEEEIDFWGEIIAVKSEDLGKMEDIYEPPPKPSVLISPPDTSSYDTGTETFNFWDTAEIGIPKLDLLESHGRFEFTEEYRKEIETPENETPGLIPKDERVEIESEQLRTYSLEPLENVTPNRNESTSEPGQAEVESMEPESRNSLKDLFRLSEDSTGSLLSASDETSDESSSKSSSATITRTEKFSSQAPVLNLSLQSDEIQQRIELETKELETKPLKREPALDSSKSKEIEEVKNSSSGIGGQVSKTEHLLWRIERFLLQQSFTSLGSEEDSGVMTDQSRQISDAETDDNDEGSHQGRIRGKSSELSHSVEKVEGKVSEVSASFVTEQQRRALNYERAKTHSRLFQLLQEECEKEDEEEVFVLANTEPAVDPRKSFSPLERNPIVQRLLRGSDSGLLSFDSSGSLSGSSGLHSPVNREQVLVDIINQFQTRHLQQTLGKNQRLSSSVFPSKIFKMLHEEFGEEFYDAFDFNEEDFSEQIQRLQSELPPVPHPEGSPTQKNEGRPKENHCQTQEIKSTKLEGTKTVTANFLNTGNDKTKKKSSKSKLKVKAESVLQSSA